MVKQDDRLIIEDCLSGNVNRFGELVSRYQKPLYNTALQMTGDADEAADITQSVFVKSFERLSSYDPEHEFFSWIYRMMINECIDLSKRRKRQVQLSEDLESRSKTPDRRFEEAETSRLVSESLQDLGMKSRIVLVLRHFVEMSYADLADVLQIPEKTVKSRLFTARRQLGEILSKKGITTYG